jgi:hypothetical protein
MFALFVAAGGAAAVDVQLELYGRLRNKGPCGEASELSELNELSGLSEVREASERQTR